MIPSVGVGRPWLFGQEEVWESEGHGHMVRSGGTVTACVNAQKSFPRMFAGGLISCIHVTSQYCDVISFEQHVNVVIAYLSNH